MLRSSLKMGGVENFENLRRETLSLSCNTTRVSKVLLALSNRFHEYPRHKAHKASPRLPESCVSRPLPGCPQHTHLCGHGAQLRGPCSAHPRPQVCSHFRVCTLSPLPRTCSDTVLLIVQVSAQTASEMSLRFIIFMLKYRVVLLATACEFTIISKIVFTKCFGMALPEQSNTTNPCSPVTS